MRYRRGRSRKPRPRWRPSKPTRRRHRRLLHRGRRRAPPPRCHRGEPSERPSRAHVGILEPRTARASPLDQEGPRDPEEALEQGESLSGPRRWHLALPSPAMRPRTPPGVDRRGPTLEPAWWAISRNTRRQLGSPLAWARCRSAFTFRQATVRLPPATLPFLPHRERTTGCHLPHGSKPHQGRRTASPAFPGKTPCRRIGAERYGT